MTYTRVIPRDLFNEANHLKCLGCLYLQLEAANCPGVELVNDGGAFDIHQNPEDGSTVCHNVWLELPDGSTLFFWRPMNSREPWPLYCADEKDTPVFTEEGKLTPEFLEVLK